MKTDIFFALVCLFGCTVADSFSHPRLECTGEVNKTQCVGTIARLTIAVEEELKMIALFGPACGFIVFGGTDTRIIFDRKSKLAIYINGNKCALDTFRRAADLTTYADNEQLIEVIRGIKSDFDSTAFKRPPTFDCSHLLQNSITIDNIHQIADNADVQQLIKKNFGAAFAVVKAFIAQLSTASVTINVFVAACFDHVSSAALELVEAFDLILQAGGNVAVMINDLFVAYSNKQLTTLIGLLKIGDRVRNLSEYKIVSLTLNIGGRDRILTLVYGRGNFHLKYWTVGDSSSTITLSVNKEKSLTCISNSIIGYTLIIFSDIRILFSHITGVGVIFNGSYVAIVTATAVGVNVQGAAVSELVLTAFALSTKATALVQTGVTISVFVKACASGSSDALVKAFGSVPASVVAVVYQTFGKLFASFTGLVNRINLGQIVTICLESSSASAVVHAFGGAITIFVSSISTALTAFNSFYIACSAALSTLFSIKIKLGESITVG